MYGKLIRSICTAHHINPQLVAAIIWQESKGCETASRYEPAFYDRYLKDFYTKYLAGKKPAKPPGYWPHGDEPPTWDYRGPIIPPTPITTHTEVMLRCTSFGLLQVMGQTAREANFRGRYLTELLIPVVNLSVGIGILATKMKRAGSLREGLLDWNGGANKQYPDEVIQWLDNGEGSFLLSC